MSTTTTETLADVLREIQQIDDSNRFRLSGGLVFYDFGDGGKRSLCGVEPTLSEKGRIILACMEECASRGLGYEILHDLNVGPIVTVFNGGSKWREMNTVHIAFPTALRNALKDI